MLGVEPTILPPQGYGPGWVWVALGCGIGAVAWAVLVRWWARRPPRPPKPTGLPPAGPPRPSLVQEYLAAVARIEADHAAGRLTGRAAHQQLSATVREFALKARGISAPTATLTDLRQAEATAPGGLAPLTGLIAQLYPPEFGPDQSGSVADAAARARRVITEWR